MTHPEACEAVKEGFVEWLHMPENRKDLGIVRQIRIPPERGLSCKLGEYHAVAVQQKEPWAQVMLADMGNHREDSRTTAERLDVDALLFTKGSAVYAATTL